MVGRWGAYGDFGSSVLIDAGLGIWPQDWLRAQATFSYRADLGFDGAANFPKLPGDDEPVSLDVESLSVMATGYLYPAPVATGPRAGGPVRQRRSGCGLQPFQRHEP